MFQSVAPHPLQRSTTLHRAGTFSRRTANDVTSQIARDTYQQQQIYALLHDTNLPDELSNKQPHRYYAYVALILSFYIAADVFTGLELGVPAFSGPQEDLVLLIGWAMHFVGILCLLIYVFVMLFKRYSYSSSLLLLIYSASICCIGACILFTSRLSSSDITDNLGGNNSIALYLQWIGSILLYIMLTYLTYKSTSMHSVHDISSDDITKHQLLMQLKHIMRDNIALETDIASHRNQLQPIIDNASHIDNKRAMSLDSDGNIMRHSYDTTVEPIKYNELDEQAVSG